jgi:tetratricopeptide (TPR) repeat protein
MQKVQAEAVKDPTNFQNILQLGNLFAQMQDTNRATVLFKQAIEMFDGALAYPGIKVENVTAMAEIAATIGNLPKLETVLQKLAAMTPGQPEPHYDLAALYAILGKNTEALQSLKTALDLSAQRLSTNPSARDLLTEARNDPRFNTLHGLPEFQQLVPNN